MIRNAFLLLGLLVLGSAASAQTLPEPRVARIADNVYALLGPIQLPNETNQGYAVNSTVIVGDQGVILVDSGSSREVGLHLSKAIRRITPKPVTHVINTHAHGDHYLGNSAFPGATIISSEKCRDMVVERGYDWVAIMERLIGRKLPDTKPIPASVRYQEGARTEVLIEGIRLVLWVPRGSHTPGDMLVYLPREKVLATGDVVVSRIVPAMQDAVIKNWIGTLQDILKLEVRTVVPGHGDLMTMSDVEALRNAMVEFYAGVKRGYAEGLDESEIRKSLDLADWEKLERAHVIGRNINRAYLEIEFDDFNQ